MTTKIEFAQDLLLALLAKFLSESANALYALPRDA
tara:strand:+ start:23199 stop:23303 length:105 start_codon:yes stop_codon:yes gene_type:complete